MSMYSDYKCGALSENEFSSLAARENRQERAYIDDFEKYAEEHDCEYECEDCGGDCCIDPDYRKCNL